MAKHLYKALYTLISVIQIEADLFFKSPALIPYQHVLMSHQLACPTFWLISLIIENSGMVARTT